MVGDWFAPLLLNGGLQMSFLMSTGLGMAIEGLFEETNWLFVFAAPTRRPQFGRYDDPGSHFAFEQGLNIRPNSISSKCFVAGQTPVGNIGICRLDTGW